MSCCSISLVPQTRSRVWSMRLCLCCNTASLWLFRGVCHVVGSSVYSVQFTKACNTHRRSIGVRHVTQKRKTANKQSVKLKKNVSILRIKWFSFLYQDNKLRIAPNQSFSFRNTLGFLMMEELHFSCARRFNDRVCLECSSCWNETGKDDQNTYWNEATSYGP